MGWIGWVLAAIAIGVAFWLRRQLAAERAHNNEIVCAKLDVDNRLDSLLTEQAARVDAGAVAGIADRLDGRLRAADEHLQRASAAFGDYREHVRQFDAAVQYCLQPVELIFGADKASLDQLVHHVEGARRKLFETRTLLEKHPLHGAADTLASVFGDLHELTGCAVDLRAHAEAEPPETAGDPVDVAERAQADTAAASR